VHTIKIHVSSNKKVPCLQNDIFFPSVITSTLEKKLTQLFGGNALALAFEILQKSVCSYQYMRPLLRHKDRVLPHFLPQKNTKLEKREKKKAYKHSPKAHFTSTTAWR
jgi:hypothetical protein